MILVAFFATLPWDSYLIRRGIWTYPPDAIIGPRLFEIPIEELFFFVVQTYITSLLYILFNKPILHAQFLTTYEDSTPKARRIRRFVQLLTFLGTVLGVALIQNGREGTYLGLILVWACPFILLAWTLSGYFLLKLPRACIAIPILLPTVYLWMVDELALGRGTWAIESGTKLGWCLWGSLDLEEALFFLASNSLVVFGLLAFDRGVAVLDTFPEIHPRGSDDISAASLMKAILMKPENYDMNRVRGIREAVNTLRGKSQSFYLASAVFPGRLRIDLILL